MRVKTIIIFFALVASVLIIWQLILPAYDQIGQKREDIEQIRKEISRLESLVKKLKELTEIYKSKEDLISKLLKVSPRGKDVASFINQAESLSAQAGTILSGITFSEQSSQKQTAKAQEGAATKEGIGQSKSVITSKSLTTNIKIVGSYSAFRNFLSNLESNIRLVDVRALNFVSKGEGTDLFDFNLSGIIYYQ